MILTAKVSAWVVYGVAVSSVTGLQFGGSPLTSPTGAELVGVVVGYLLILATSGRVVTRVLSTAAEYEQPSARERDIGAIVGKAENLLVVTFVLVGAYTALAVVFAAKSIVRREDMKNNSLFYLAGTLVNFTYSVLVGLVIRLVVTFV